MAKQEFDVIVIGAGPGGYVAAIRAAQLGLKTACVEASETLGGTCLNIGCIPSKALLQSSENYAHVKHHASEHGIKVGSVSLDLGTMLKRKDDVVKSLTKGIEGLLKKNKVTWIKGYASFSGPKEIRVKGSSDIFGAKAFIIATGSVPVELGIAKFDGKNIVSSTEALSFPVVPEHLVVIGGGYIGLEMGSVWARLGAKVTVIEAQNSILALMDGAVQKSMTKIIAAQGLEIHTGTKLEKAEIKKGKVTVSCTQSGKPIEFVADKVLVCVGRKPMTDGLGLDKAGVKMGERGTIAIDDHFRTNVPGIYAIGDVTRGPMLAHKAEEEGVATAEIIAGQHGHVNYAAIPGVVYTWPEAATVGLTEEQCREQKLEIKIGQFPFMANGRAKALGLTDGFIKVIADSRTDRILGIHMVGPNVSELIAEAAVAMEFGASAEDLARSVHAHPTLAEVMKEACLGVDKRSIHI